MPHITCTIAQEKGIRISHIDIAIGLWANTNAKQTISLISYKNSFDRIAFPGIKLNKENEKLSKTFIHSVILVTLKAAVNCMLNSLIFLLNLSPTHAGYINKHKRARTIPNKLVSNKLLYTIHKRARAHARTFTVNCKLNSLILLNLPTILLPRTITNQLVIIYNKLSLSYLKPKRALTKSCKLNQYILALYTILKRARTPARIFIDNCKLNSLIALLNLSPTHARYIINSFKLKLLLLYTILTRVKSGNFKLTLDRRYKLSTLTVRLAKQASIDTIGTYYYTPTQPICRLYNAGTSKRYITQPLFIPTTSEIRVLRYRAIKAIWALRSPKYGRTLKAVATAAVLAVFSVNPLSRTNCRTCRTCMATTSLDNIEFHRRVIICIQNEE